MSDPTRQRFTQETENLQQALQAGFLPRWLSSVLALGFYGFLLLKPGTTAAVLGLGTAGFGTSLLWVGALLVALAFGTMVCATFIGPILFHRLTGILYRQDRMSYARAGGYDVNGLTMIGTQIALFGVWWAIPCGTWMDALRHGWSFALLSFLLGIGVATLLYTIAFARHGRR